MANSADERLLARDEATKARAHGFLDFGCPACGQFSMVMSGDVTKCDSCGVKIAADQLTIIDASGADTDLVYPIERHTKQNPEPRNVILPLFDALSNQ